jgi:hypothetical protein
VRAFLQVDVVGMVRKKMRVGREGKRIMIGSLALRTPDVI